MLKNSVERLQNFEKNTDLCICKINHKFMVNGENLKNPRKSAKTVIKWKIV